MMVLSFKRVPLVFFHSKTLTLSNIKNFVATYYYSYPMGLWAATLEQLWIKLNKTSTPESYGNSRWRKCFLNYMLPLHVMHFVLLVRYILHHSFLLALLRFQMSIFLPLSPKNAISKCRFFYLFHLRMLCFLPFLSIWISSGHCRLVQG